MIDRILIVRLGAVGDVIHTLPLAAALRRKFSDVCIGWAVEPGAYPLLAGNPAINEVCLVDTRKWRKGSIRERARSLKVDFQKVRDFRADIAIDAQGLIKSGLLTWGSGAKVRVGFENRFCREGMNVLFTNVWSQPPTRPHHVVEKNLSLLNSLGVSASVGDEVEFPLPDLSPEMEAVDAFLRSKGLADGRPLLMIHPGAGWETKKWDEKRYASLGDAWVKMSEGHVLLSWGPGEENAARRVADAMEDVADLLPSTNIRKLAALIQRCDIFAGGDSGPLHIAAALGIPCLAVMGPTDPVRNGPWGPNHFVLHHNLACSGCYLRTCPDIECLDRIGANEAIQGLSYLWESHEKIR